MHQPCPLAEGMRVHRQHQIKIQYLDEPRFQFVGFGGILTPRDLYSRLNFADGHRR